MNETEGVMITHCMIPFLEAAWSSQVHRESRMAVARGWEEGKRQVIV